MMAARRMHPLEWLGLALVLVLALGLRAGYLLTSVSGTDPRPPLEVQGVRLVLSDADGAATVPESLVLARNIADYGWFGGPAPLASGEEVTAHVAPGYPWLLSLALRFTPEPVAWVRWAQCALGLATVALLFFFTRRAFANASAAFLAGLLAASHPFWILNTAEIADGTVAVFLAAAAFALGTRAAQQGGAFASLLFGLTLAAAAMVRAAFLPFAVVALLWFLWHCRTLSGGWLCGLLAFLGLGNGLAPWMVRNLQVFEEPLPVVSSLHLHLWIGSHDRADGGSLESVGDGLTHEERVRFAAIEHQPARYAALGGKALEQWRQDPAAALGRRLNAGLKFIVGDRWLQPDPRLAAPSPDRSAASSGEWVVENAEIYLRAALLFLVLLGLLGWRCAHPWKATSRLATLAAIWLPLPYLLTHAERLSGPRLPFDAVAICFAALALSRLIPSGDPEDAASD